MLIEFSVGNFRSFKDRVTLSMVAANLVSKDKALDAENTIPVDDNLTLLTSAAIYGANASGKSNLVKAVSFMRDFVLNSSRETQIEDPIKVEVFRLSTETEDQPSFFEVVFLLKGTKYRYGFEVTTQRVVAEWLFWVPKVKEARLFERQLDDIKLGTGFKEGKGIEERTRSNALFLSVVAQFNGDISKHILFWFTRINVNLGIDVTRDMGEALWRLQAIYARENVLRFIEDLDIGINSLHPERVLQHSPSGREFSELQEAKEAVEQSLGTLTEIRRIKTLHPKYDSDGNVVGSEWFDLTAHESAGTQRLFSVALPIMDTLKNGFILLVDELDARLHPLITCALIGLFNSKQRNPNGAQLVFTTHDTNLLSNQRFRRDQIWFTEKDRFGASHLYSLAEFKVRNDASYEKDYIQGRYGAIPFINIDLQVMVGGDDASA